SLGQRGRVSVSRRRRPIYFHSRSSATEGFRRIARSGLASLGLNCVSTSAEGTKVSHGCPDPGLPVRLLLLHDPFLLRKPATTAITSTCGSGTPAQRGILRGS